jgi:hypothetical protein
VTRGGKAKGKTARGDEGKATEVERVGAEQGGGVSGISSKTEDVSKLPEREGISAVAGTWTAGGAQDLGERGSKEYPALRRIVCATSGLQRRIVFSISLWAFGIISC